MFLEYSPNYGKNNAPMDIEMKELDGIAAMHPADAAAPPVSVPILVFRALDQSGFKGGCVFITGSFRRNQVTAPNAPNQEPSAANTTYMELPV
jgi:hypothetical protein